MEVSSTKFSFEEYAPSWLLRFVNNLGVYLVFFAVGYYILKRVKSKPEPSPSDPSVAARWTRFLFFGPPEQVPQEEEMDPKIESKLPKSPSKKLTPGHEATKSETPKPVEEASFLKNALNLVFCVVGLLVTFLSWGLLQERIMTTKYETGYFESANFTVFCSRTFGWFLAFIILKFTSAPPMRAPFYEFSLTSFSNVMSSYCQLEALKYLSFPTQVLGKSSKMIPVMIMGKVLSGKKYPVYEYVVAVVMLVGVAAFMLSEKSDIPAEKMERTTSIAGLVLLVGYLTFDSFTSQWQDHLFKQYNLSSYQMMLGVNSFSASLTLLSLVQMGEFMSSVQFLLDNSECMLHIMLFSISGATGSMFIFYTIKSFGPLVFTMIMVTRQLIAIVLSCVLYGHEIGTQGAAGAAVVFGAIGYRMWRKEQDRKAGNARRAAQKTAGDASESGKLIDEKKDANSEAEGSSSSGSMSPVRQRKSNSQLLK